MSLLLCSQCMGLGSSVTLNMFWCVFMGGVMLSICISGLVLYFVESGVNRVQVVLSELGIRLLSFSMFVIVVDMVVCMFWILFCWCVLML